jgi:hypothetical protein
VREREREGGREGGRIWRRRKRDRHIKKKKSMNMKNIYYSFYVFKYNPNLSY